MQAHYSRHNTWCKVAFGGTLVDFFPAPQPHPMKYN